MSELCGNCNQQEVCQTRFIQLGTALRMGPPAYGEQSPAELARTEHGIKLIVATAIEAQTSSGCKLTTEQIIGNLLTSYSDQQIT